MSSGCPVAFQWRGRHLHVERCLNWSENWRAKPWEAGPSPQGGSRKKGIHKAYKDFFAIFSVKYRVLKLRFLAFPEGPGGFRELREAGRNHFHLSWYLLVPGVTSYDQKANKENTHINI